MEDKKRVKGRSPVEHKLCANSVCADKKRFLHIFQRVKMKKNREEKQGPKKYIPENRLQSRALHCVNVLHTAPMAPSRGGPLRRTHSHVSLFLSTLKLLREC